MEMATLVAKAHPHSKSSRQPSTTTVTSSPNPSWSWPTCQFSLNNSEFRRPLGHIHAFWHDHLPRCLYSFEAASVLLATGPLTNTSTLKYRNHTINAKYSSDTVCRSEWRKHGADNGPTPTPVPIQVTVQTNPTGFTFSVDVTLHTTQAFFSGRLAPATPLRRLRRRAVARGLVTVWKAGLGGAISTLSHLPQTRPTQRPSRRNITYDVP